MQFSKVYADCLKYLGAHLDYSGNTIDQYDTTYRQFQHYLMTRDLNDDLRHFTTETIEGFVGWLIDQKVSTNTVRHRLTALSTLARFARKRRDAKGRALLPENPTEGVEWPTYRRPATRFLHRSELFAFLALSVPMHEAIARALFVETGLRVSELVRANVGDLLEGPGGAVSLAVTVKGKGRRSEVVHTPISTGLVALLHEGHMLRTMPDPGEPLLVNSLGGRWTRAGLTEMIRRLGEKAGITRLPVRPHVLRHTANVIARAAGLDPFVRSKLLHHRHPQSLERYEHLLSDELHQARARTVEGLDRYLGERAPSPMSPSYVEPLAAPSPTLQKDADEA